MPYYQSATQQAFYKSLPKVELHRHLEGSLRLETLRTLAALHHIAIPTDLQSAVQMQPADPNNSATFLSKFPTLRLFFRSLQVIQRLTREVVADAAADGVLYLELLFTPVALARHSGVGLGKIIDAVIEAAHEAAAAHGMQVRLVASVNRHEPVALAEETLAEAARRAGRGIVGFNLAGDEANFDGAPFARVFESARTAGLGVSIHAGEWAGAGSVRQAIELLGAQRIGHGVRILEDPAVIELARRRQVAFEVCLTSNVQTGVVPSLAQHPLLRMLNAGLNVTLNTDDPGISQVTLSGEYRTACEDLGLPMPALQNCITAAARASFLPAAEKEALLKRLA